MSTVPFEKLLLLFLDPKNRHPEKSWVFVGVDGPSKNFYIANEQEENPKNIIYCFSRRRLLPYFLFLLEQKRKKQNESIETVLFVNDGLLSSFFYAKNISNYHSFSVYHLPKAKGFRKKFISLLPVVFRAEQRFVFRRERIVKNRFDEPGIDMADGLDFMFFSNPLGKQLLARGEIFQKREGKLVITTANPGYIKTIEKEYATISRILNLLDNPEMVPGIGECFQVDGRLFYTEDYIQGENLLEKIRTLGQRDAFSDVIKVIQQLEEWFRVYRSSFADEKKPFMSLYDPMLKTFSEVYGSNNYAQTLVQIGKQILVRIESETSGFVPVISHNDLWPGNFLINSEHLIAIDWERATENRSPIFDFFWMMISTSMEFLVGRSGSQDYSKHFRIYLEQKDIVCRYTHDRLIDFLKELGIEKTNYFSFVLLFLMEWSIQGYSALGRQTPMDKLAVGELNNYAKYFLKEIRKAS